MAATTWRPPLAAGAVLLALAGCDPTLPVPQVSIGLNTWPPGLERRFSWTGLPGASAYLVAVSSDRQRADLVATSGFTADTSLPLSRLAWREGHPLPDRSYFWTLRAYDRPDPQGLQLVQSEPREFRPAPWEGGPWRLVGP